MKIRGLTLVPAANLFWKSADKKNNLSPRLSPPPNLFVVCVCKGTRPEWSSWKRSCQRPAGCWPSRKPRSCPSRVSTGRLTHTRRWLSSKLGSLKDLEAERKRCSPQMNFCPLPVASYSLHCLFFLRLFFYVISHRYHRLVLAAVPNLCRMDHFCFSFYFHGLSGFILCERLFSFKLYSWQRCDK